MTWLLNSVMEKSLDYLGWAFFIYGASLFVYTIWNGRRPKHAETWMKFADKLRRFKKKSGGILTPRVAMVMAMCMMAALVLGMTKFKVHQLHDVYVIGYDSDYHYHLRAPLKHSDGREQVTEFWTTFCHDYEPLFSTGQTLKVLTYEDAGACWSIANTHPAYLIERDENGNPIIR